MRRTTSVAVGVGGSSLPAIAGCRAMPPRSTSTAARNHTAGVPMLTVTHGRPATRRHIFAYTLVLAPFALALGLTSIGGPLYLAVALVLNVLFIHGGWLILRRTETQAQADGYRVEKAFFRLSLYYLALHFAALAVQAAAGAW